MNNNRIKKQINRKVLIMVTLLFALLGLVISGVLINTNTITTARADACNKMANSSITYVQEPSDQEISLINFNHTYVASSSEIRLMARQENNSLFIEFTAAQGSISTSEVGQRRIATIIPPQGLSNFLNGIVMPLRNIRWSETGSSLGYLRIDDNELTIEVTPYSHSSPVIVGLYEQCLLVPLPPDPIKAGHIFKGWYLDELFKMPLIDSMVYGSKIHARWARINVRVVFMINGAMYRQIDVYYGTLVVDIAAHIDVFKWYLDEDKIHAVDINTYVQSSLTLWGTSDVAPNGANNQGLSHALRLLALLGGLFILLAFIGLLSAVGKRTFRRRVRR